MWKRNAVFLVCRHLCDHGVSPEELADLIDWRRIWYPVEGELSAEEFEAAATESAAAGGYAYSNRRWFTDEDQLVRWNGRTYAFSSQWGGEGWHKVMALLQESYPQFHIEYTPIEGQ